MSENVIIETERLILRRFSDTDADAGLLLELDSDPDVLRHINPAGGTVALPDVAAYRERIRTVFIPQYAHPGRGCGAAHEKATGRFIGWVFLRDATRHRFAAEAGWTRPTDLELGYRLRREAWGKGYATEASAELIRRAFADPEVTGVVAAALATNRASRRVLEKLGMAHARDFAAPGYADPVAAYALPRPTNPAA